MTATHLTITETDGALLVSCPAWACATGTAILDAFDGADEVAAFARGLGAEASVRCTPAVAVLLRGLELDEVLALWSARRVDLGGADVGAGRRRGGAAAGRRSRGRLPPRGAATPPQRRRRGRRPQRRGAAPAGTRAHQR